MTLERTKYTVEVKEVFRTATVSDETPEGRIMWIAKDGQLNEWRPLVEIEKLLTARGWGIERLTVFNGVKKLVKQGFLGQRKTNRLEYKLAPNVTFS
jgi:hypothetical protein